MSNITKYLELLGFSENESKVYLSLYKMGNSVAGTIIKDTELPRASVYQILDKLIEKGLVFKVDKNNILNFMAEEPEKILYNLTEQQENIERKKKIYKSLVPELIKYKNPGNYIPKVSYFEGIESYINLLDEILDSKVKEIYMITNSKINAKHVGDEIKNKKIHNYEIGDFLKERVQRKIKLNLITTDTLIGNDLKKKDNSELRVTKLLPSSFGDVESMIIYSDKVLILTDNSPIIGIYIEDKQLRNMFINIFKFIWNNI